MNEHQKVQYVEKNITEIIKSHVFAQFNCRKDVNKTMLHKVTLYLHQESSLISKAR